MEYSEYPGVENINRKLKFSEIKWLSKEKFRETIKNAKTSDQVSIHPRLNDNSDVTKLEFIGKTIPSSPTVSIITGVNDDTSINSSSAPYQYLERAGTVFMSSQRSNCWKLRITHESRVYEIEEDFLVLSIDDPDAFYWCSNKDLDSIKNQYSFTVNYKEIPRYALRVSVDKVDNRYSFIGMVY